MPFSIYSAFIKPTTSTNPTAGIEARFKQLTPAVSDALRDCTELKALLPAVIRFLKTKGHENHSETVAHFLMGKIAASRLPPALQNLGSVEAFDRHADQSVKTQLHKLMSTHCWSFLGIVESSDKTLAKLEWINARLSDEPISNGAPPASSSAQFLQWPDQEASEVWVPERDLFARVKRQDPAVTEVRMWQSTTRVFASGQRAEVFTAGLVGCTAIALLSKFPNGTRSITLSHYPAVSTYLQLRELDRALKTEMHEVANPDVQHELYVITPGENEQDHEGNWRLRERDPELLAAINKTVQTRLPEMHATVLPYSMTCGAEKSSAFILSVPSTPDEPVRYSGNAYGVCRF